MTTHSYKSALIVGAGAGLSASLTRLFAKEGISVSIAARNPDKLADLCSETGSTAYACDASDRTDVENLFSDLDAASATPDVVVNNPSFRTRGAFVELDPDDVEKAIAITAYGAFLVAQQAAKRMVDAGQGAIFFTGASAGVKGYPQSAPFAMGKFALRGMAQSMARELHPQNIHIAHFVIDGGILNPGRSEPADRPDSMLRPDAIAQSYLDVLRQDRSIWAWEIELRPWVENF